MSDAIVDDIERSRASDLFDGISKVDFVVANYVIGARRCGQLGLFRLGHGREDLGTDELGHLYCQQADAACSGVDQAAAV